MNFTLGQREARDLVETFVNSRDALREALTLDGLYPWYVEHAKKLLELYETFRSGTDPAQIDQNAFDLAYIAYCELYK